MIGIAIAGADGVDASVADALQFLTPQMFGVTNDGVTDFTENLRSMHSRANVLGIPCNYFGITKLSIQSDAQIVINTDVDFAGCDFTVLNGIENPPDFTYRRLFVVRDDSISPRVITLNTAELYEGAYKFTVPDDLGQGMLHISSNKVINGRVFPATDLFFEQVFKINRKGVADFPLSEDLTANTVTATFYKSPNKWVRLKNLTANEDTFNNQTLVSVRRNLVEIDGVTVLPRTTDTGVKNINALITVYFCCDFVLTKCASTGQQFPIGNDGTYVFAMDYVANARFDKVGSETGWGSFGCNHISGLFVTNSSINRVESHSGAHNIFVDKCVMSEFGVRYGWGGGTISITNSVVNDISPITWRGDYGGHFNGDLVVDDVTLVSTLKTGTPANPSQISIVNIPTVGGTLPIKLANSIIVRNVRARLAAADGEIIIRPILVGIRSGCAVSAPITMVVERITSNRLAHVSISASLSLLRTNTAGITRLMISECNSLKSVNDSCPMLLEATNQASQPVDGVNLEVQVSNCKNVSGYFATKNAKVSICDSTLNGYKNFSGAASNQFVYVDNVIMEDTVVIAGSPQGQIGDPSATARNIFRNLHIRAAANIASADALQGVLIDSGIAVTLPGAATIATAFTGFKNAKFS